MGYETYPKGSKPSGAAPDPVHEENTGNPYFNKANMGDSPEEQMDRRMNVYGPGTSKKLGSQSYPKENEAPDGVPANPRRTMITV